MIMELARSGRSRSSACHSSGSNRLRLRRRIGASRPCGSTLRAARGATASASPTVAATRPSAKWRSIARAARASAAWTRVLPGAVGDPDDSPCVSGRSGCASAASRHKIVELLARGVDPPLRRGRAQVGEPLAAMLDLAAEQRRRQPRARFGQRGAALGRARRQARAASARQSRRAAGRAARAALAACRPAQRREALARPRASPRTDARASRWPKLAEQHRQLGAHRHRHLGGGGRGRRAAVGGEVDQRGVGLMPDRARSAGSARRRRRAPLPPR